MLNHTGKNYDEMTREELEQELRESFLDTDTIDEPLNDELEKLRETLNRKWPLEYLYTPEESWERFLENYAEFFPSIESKPDVPDKEKAEQHHELELMEREGAQTRVVRIRSASALVRKVLIAAMIVVLLTGAVLAAGPRLWVWVRGWSAVPGDTAGGVEMSKQIAAALEEQGITEPVYPSYLPDGFALAEAYVSQDPLLLYELYTRGDRFLSITVTSVSASVMAMYPREDLSSQKYEAGETAHYLFSSDGSITAVWYTDNCFVSISGNIAIRLMKRIIDSVYAR